MSNAQGRARARWYTAGLAGLTGVASVATLSGTAAATNPNEAVPCSPDALTAAIVHANAAGGAQLTLTPRCTYTLTTNQGPDGLPIITQPITVDGQDATITRAATATNFRILNVGVGGNLTLTNLTITGGIAPGSPGGGGILIQAGGQATLHNTTVAGNRSAAVGGGIANYGITTLVGDDRGGNGVDNNSSQTSGGGIYNEGRLSTKDVEVSYNTSGSLGGGLIDQGAAVLEQTRIDHNTAASNGGGITSAAAITKLTDSSVSDNTAGSGGGGIASLLSAVYLRGTTVDRNTATGNGGGIDIEGFTTIGSSSVVVEDSEINGNTARGDGGGIRIRLSNLVLRRSHVDLNKAIGAASQGGGVSNSSGRLDLTATQVTENSSTVAPGGIFTNDPLVTVDQKSVIVANRPTNCTGSAFAVPNCFG
ncbi:right-handed parallel beta-helix repeat-containing protein [Rugosimonospora africana]|uniref:Outer membrane repeat protein n=1 Tax=Rugosimonospora africana TaxID=556532 RepID=A0A8J3R2Y1_9ACTN|nr:right-handed parallel beta-helix repeat-containing protein [Rugosimonospora africana]GIH19206.1 hypothetical protein Raf01_73780 [Rugosimonospora africana]